MVPDEDKRLSTLEDNVMKIEARLPSSKPSKMLQLPLPESDQQYYSSMQFSVWMMNLCVLASVVL